jgi:aldehyde:ferredoxin oxidoreductase
MGYGTRKHDKIPYRAVGPVTKEEYISRMKRYDNQLNKKLGINPEFYSIEDRIRLLRKFREKEYQKLKDAVYKRRGWNINGIPTIKKINSLGLDFPELIAFIK